MTVGNVTTSAAPPQLYVTHLAQRRAEWATTRQAAIAGNIANADTPRYKARDISAFEADLDRTRLQLAATDARHMIISDLELRAEAIKTTDTWDHTHSSNTVSLDEELMKADDTARSHQLAVSVMGTFHRMLLSSVATQ
ncbi:MAG: flagellar basal body protein [Pseudomonadota bacterium]